MKMPQVKKVVFVVDRKNLDYQTTKEKVSILDDVDFELELIHSDKINMTYILKLLANLKDVKKEG